MKILDTYLYVLLTPMNKKWYGLSNLCLISSIPLIMNLRVCMLLHISKCFYILYYTLNHTHIYIYEEVVMFAKLKLKRKLSFPLLYLWLSCVSISSSQNIRILISSAFNTNTNAVLYIHILFTFFSGGRTACKFASYSRPLWRTADKFNKSFL